MWKGDAGSAESVRRVKYPVLGSAQAALRAEEALHVLDSSTDVGLDDRLTEVLQSSYDGRDARAVATEVKHLYDLMADLHREGPDKPVDLAVLHQCLTLAMSRPVGEPIWDDYQRYCYQIAEAWQRVKISGSNDSEQWQPVIAARKSFTQAWRA